jgi:hypothetical protein
LEIKEIPKASVYEKIVGEKEGFLFKGLFLSQKARMVEKTNAALRDSWGN